MYIIALLIRLFKISYENFLYIRNLKLLEIREEKTDQAKSLENISYINIS